MARINGPDGKIYSQPTPSADGTTWAPFEDANHIRTVRSALGILTSKIANMKSANDYFSGLPGRQSFTDVVKDNRIWISYDPNGPDSAETVGLHITIGRTPLRWGLWAVAATLVHELAHINGATDIDGQAEKALLYCGLKQHYVKSNSVPKPPR